MEWPNNDRQTTSLDSKDGKPGATSYDEAPRRERTVSPVVDSNTRPAATGFRPNERSSRTETVLRGFRQFAKKIGVRGGKNESLATSNETAPATAKIYTSGSETAR